MSKSSDLDIELSNQELQLVSNDSVVNEEIEGLDPNKVYSDGWGDDFPIDSVLVRSDSRTLGDVVRRINNNRYILDPDFQRGFVWSPYKQSKLIESVIMRLPLPVFYVAEGVDGRITVVDGLQRLTTFSDFLNNRFKLKYPSGASEYIKEKLANKSYSELPIKMQERIEDTQLIMYILDSKLPERAKLDIFDRVNSGVPLSRQQMRNALFCGPATKWLKSIVESQAFQIATNQSLNSKNMRDREAVNRFVSFTLIGWEKYRGNMDEFLAEGLKQLQVQTEDKLVEWQKKLEDTLFFCHEVFGVEAFRKPSPTNRRSVINISLFDVITVIFYKYFSDLVKIDKKIIRESVKKLLYNIQFNECITISTNSTKSVRFRYQELDRVVQELIEG